MHFALICFVNLVAHGIIVYFYMAYIYVYRYVAVTIAGNGLKL